MAGYTRQSSASIQPGEDVTAGPLNDEFDQLASAFNASTGHAHDGTTGNSPPINLATSVTGVLPQANGGTGSSDGTATFTTITASTKLVTPLVVAVNSTSQVVVSGDTTGSTGANLVLFGGTHATTAGDFALRDGTDDIIYYDKSGNTTTFSADTVVIPTATITTGTITTATLTSADINGGTVDNTAIGATIPSTGAFTTLTASSIDGAVIGGSSAAAGTFTTLNATGGGALAGTWSNLGTVTTVDINGGTVDNVIIGGTTPAAGTFTTLNATGGGALTGTWSDLGIVTTVDINGGTADGIVIGGSSAAAGTFTNLTASGTISFSGATISDLGTVTTVDINGGSVDGITLGTNSAVTEADIDNININGNTISSTDTNGDVVISPNGTGKVDLDTSGLKGVSSFNGGPLGEFRNKIINGNFDFWQRGTGGIASGYTADRWKLDPGAGATNSVSRGTNALGLATVPGSPRYNLAWARSVAGTLPSVLSQRIEGVDTFAGQTITVTFYASASATTEIYYDLYQFFGTGGSPSGSVDGGDVTVGLTTSVQKFSATYVLSSVAGKTVGTNGNDWVGLRFVRNHDTSNPTATVYLHHVSVVLGDATGEDDPFSPRHPQQELALCQRYFEKSYDINTTPGTVTLNGKWEGCFARATSNQNYGFVIYSNRKRAVPTVTIYSPDSGSSGNYYDRSNATDRAGQSSGGGDAAFCGQPASSTGVSLGGVWSFHWTADAEL